ncbi:Ank3 [Symbiodinium sp. CCMP2592]|nr:Ank3 [Symbiodinium sp. CCMP2592]
MPLGSTPYGANVGTWEACLDLCRDTTGCEQVVYRDGYCYGMSESSDEDQDGLGGSNEHYTSAHCTSANTIEMCAAAALNLYTDVEIQGFAFPKALQVSLDSKWLEDALEDAILLGAQAMIDMMIGPAACIPGANYATRKISEVAQGAVGLVKGLIPDLSLDFSTPSMVLLAPKKLFCVEVAKTPGFDTAPCNAELGCSHAGRGTPQLAQQKDVEMEAEPAELLQLAGDAAPTRTCTVYKKWRMRWLGSHVEMPLGSTPYGANVGTWEACLGLCQTTEGCRQVVYVAGHCYGMSVASNEDQDGLGGHNDLFTSAHCIGAERHCDIFLNWRMVMVPGSGISLGSLPYGEFSGGWFRCLELCKETPACQQVTYTAEGRCFGMGARTHQDANGLAGTNWGFTTAHCYGEVSGPSVVMQSPGCPNVFMGDRFLDLGPWRLAAWDDNHLSIAHKTGQAAIVFRSDGVVLHQRTDLLAFSRPVAPPKGIKFGFQFIQIGEFRLGAVNDNHFSIQHSGGNTVQAFGSDGAVYPGPLEDFGTFDRPVMAAEGVNFGDGFLQMGRFRLVVIGSDLVLSHGSGSTNQVWKSDGTAQPASGSPHLVAALQPAPWTCKDLQELAFGACGAFGAFGDRFVELGNWRLAAIDATHLSISHKGGQTPQIYRADGVMIPGRHDYSAWHRPKGFPSGIVFGSRFIQIGNFRLGDADGHHFSISHENGITIQIFRSDGTLHPGPRHELNLWSRTAGPPQGITFGDRFLEIGLWRFADVDGEHFALSQAGGQTAQIFRSDNRLFPGPNAHWTGVFDRYPEYHCGSIHSVFGSCTGLVTGDRFIQLGDWRLADIDGNHFSLSCKTGQTSQVFHRDGAVMTGPRTDFGAWKREAKGLEAPGVTFGDRFVEPTGLASGVCGQKATSLSYPTKQGPARSFSANLQPLRSAKLNARNTFAPGEIGHFRLGDVDGAHFTISHPVHHSTLGLSEHLFSSVKEV